jgi:hypothetical protein
MSVDKVSVSKRIHPMPNESTVDGYSREFDELTRLTNAHNRKDAPAIDEVGYPWTCFTTIVVIGAFALLAILGVAVTTNNLIDPVPVIKPIEIKWKCPAVGETGECKLTRPFTLMPISIDVPFERHWLNYTQ